MEVTELSLEIQEEILLFLPPKFINLARLSSLDICILVHSRQISPLLSLLKHHKDDLTIGRQIRWAAKTGCLEVLKWLHSTYIITRKDVCYKRWKNAVLGAMEYSRRTAEIGEANLEVVMWLQTTFNIIHKIGAKYLYSIAASDGCLEVLQWLYLTHRSPSVDHIEWCFAFAAKNGHLKVLKWFHSTFNLSEENAKANDCLAFRYAGYSGCLEVLKWLYSTFNFTRNDVRSKENLLIHIVAAAGRLEVLKWLHSTFNFSRRDITSLNNYAYQISSANLHFKTHEWLKTTFYL
jgi:hypothetical protein